MKFVHSADWQLGARFAQFGTKAHALREARVQTLRMAVDMAKRVEADAFLIAGDLFVDSQVDDTIVQTALGTFATAPGLPVFILPGNHDPYTGPGCLWERSVFANKPNNVTVLTQAGIYEVGGASLIASPLQQKVSTMDPSVKFAELAERVAADRIRIGITHGALAIPGKYQLNDFPISLDAATRANLDYVALGHWHNHQVYDNGRLIMSGTPEPDAFEQSGAGFVTLAEITRRGTTPILEQISMATLQWESFGFDFLDPEQSRLSLTAKLGQLRPRADKSVVRVTLRGGASASALDEKRRWLESALEPFLVAQIQDDSSAMFTAAELEELRQQHPLLAQTILDLLQIEHLVHNIPLPPEVDTISAIPLTEAQQLLADAKIELSRLDGEFFRLAHRLLSQKLREVS